MTRLQGLTASRRYLVTLNRPSGPEPRDLVETIDYEHPTYTADAMGTQARLSALNAGRSASFCGSYFGYGFHEDAVRSGVEVARRFGLEL
jgi:predicted NAD/FAD-binding protein